MTREYACDCTHRTSSSPRKSRWMLGKPRAISPFAAAFVCASMRRRAGRPRINPSVLPTELEAMRRSIPSVRRRSNVICERQPMGAHTRAQTRQKVAPQMQSSHSVHDFVHGVFDARLTDQSNLAQLKRAKGHRDYLRERIGKLCSTRLTVAHTSDCRLLIGRKKNLGGFVVGVGRNALSSVLERL